MYALAVGAMHSRSKEIVNASRTKEGLLLRWRQGANGIRRHDLVAFIKPLLRCLWLARTRSGKGESGNHCDFNDLLFEEFWQVIDRTGLCNEFRL